MNKNRKKTIDKKNCNKNCCIIGFSTADAVRAIIYRAYFEIAHLNSYIVCDIMVVK